MGDSAGGGLCVWLAQEIKQAGLTLPANIVLLSPYLSTDVKPAPIDDPWIAIPGAIECGKLWGPESEPLSRDCTELTTGRFLLFCGTRDCLVWQARELKRKVPEIEYKEAEGLIHIWPTLPIPEADEDLLVIKNALIQS